MPKIAYINRKFSVASLEMIERTNKIVEAYTAQGYSLSLRQIYYQHVSRDWLPNRQSEYQKLGSVLNDARLAGLVDWNAIEDRGRNLKEQSKWDSPSDIVGACAAQFRFDKWDNQPNRVEVWIEKDALAGVFERICNELQVPFISTRGYMSVSEMWVAAQRHRNFQRQGQQVIVLNFQDHDPSGLDMTRDIEDRLSLFGSNADVKRLALNMKQVEEYNPPPNPAKSTDSRFEGYVDKFGDESWELDALEPSILSSLVREEVEALRDEDLWNERNKEEKEARRTLSNIADRWDFVVDQFGESEEEEE